MPGPAAGQPCTADGDCDARKPLICDEMTQTCETVAVHSSGGCHWGDAICDYGTNCLGDLCHPSPKEGESCTHSAGVYCTYPAACIRDVCTLDYPASCP